MIKTSIQSFLQNPYLGGTGRGFIPHASVDVSVGIGVEMQE